ncbi:STAS domain-containing protein [Sphingomonas sp. NCPPB 2930]
MARKQTAKAPSRGDRPAAATAAAVLPTAEAQVPAQMLVLPTRLMHEDAQACLRMLTQGLQHGAQPQDVPVVADASALSSFDSSALAVLLACRREALAIGRSFVVRGLHPRLAGLAGLYGVSALLPAG